MVARKENTYWKLPLTVYSLWSNKQSYKYDQNKFDFEGNFVF
jgi:hypothetical protein